MIFMNAVSCFSPFKTEGSYMILYTRELCISALKQFISDRGQIPSRTQYMEWCVGKTDTPSTRVILNFLAKKKRTWKEVLEVLGYTKEQVRKQTNSKQSKFTRKSCIEALNACCKALGHSPQQVQYGAWLAEQVVQYPSSQSIVRLGDPDYPNRKSWINALSFLGIDTVSIPKRVITRKGITRTRDELIIELLSCHTDIGEVPSSYAYDFWVQDRVKNGDNPPTQTTLRRRLDTEGNTWAGVLRNAGLDPEKISEKSNRLKTEAEEARCKESLRAFVEHFTGLPPLSLYLRWSMLDPNRASLTCILNRIGGRNRKWNHAIKQAGLDSYETISSDEALKRNGFLPAISTKEECVEALRKCRDSLTHPPGISAFRYWAAQNNCTVTEIEILYRLSPDNWKWSTALDRAFL